MEITGKWHQIPLLFSLVLLNACPLLENISSGSVSTRSAQTGALGHGASTTDSELTLSRAGSQSHANIFKVQKSTQNSNVVRVDLPEDRCKSGSITFHVSGKEVTCSVLGRGVARWNWSTPPARHSFECMGGKVHTVASDWQKGNGCYFLKSHKRCGATPTGTYSLTGFGGAPAKWGNIQAVTMQPRFRTNRGGLLTHSDNRFGQFKGVPNSSPDIENWTHSSAGCLKLEPQCQQLLADFYRQHGRGSTMVVQ